MHSALTVAVIAFVTLLLRFLPFLAFRGRNLPPVIGYLSTVLPYAIMGMLVVYCLKNVTFLTSPFGIPEIVSVALVVLLHKWRHSTLLSIIGGTACYIVLVQLVF